MDERRGISFPIQYIENDDDGSGTDVDEPNEEDREMRKKTSFEINKSIFFFRCNTLKMMMKELLKNHSD